MTAAEGRTPPGGSGADQEFQLETRHLAFLIFIVVVLCVASFMLGRWVERQSAGPALSALTGEGGGTGIEEMGDVSEDLTFFDSLKSDKPVPLEESSVGDRTPMPAVATAPAGAAASGSHRSVEEGVFIQVLATAQRSAASSLRRRLRDRGYTALLVSEAGAWKVRVGPYADHEEAERVAQRLRELEGVTTWIP